MFEFLIVSSRKWQRWNLNTGNLVLMPLCLSLPQAHPLQVPAGSDCLVLMVVANPRLRAVPRDQPGQSPCSSEYLSH